LTVLLFGTTTEYKVWLSLSLSVSPYFFERLKKMMSAAVRQPPWFNHYGHEDSAKRVQENTPNKLETEKRIKLADEEEEDMELEMQQEEVEESKEVEMADFENDVNELIVQELDSFVGLSAVY